MKVQSHNIIILGAGPAGLQLSYCLKQAGIAHIVLEQSAEAGSTYSHFPIHRQLISVNKVHTGFEKKDPINLRFDWHSLLTKGHELRFTEYTHEYFPDRSIFLQYLHDFTSKYGLPIQYNTCLTQIEKTGDQFVLKTSQNNKFTTKQLVIATGLSKDYLPNIPGLMPEMHYSHLTLDKTPYYNKRVLILGKGNSGFETADHLTDAAALIHIASPNPIKMAWKTHYVGHLRAVNNNFLDTYQLKSQNAAINAEINHIEKVGEQYAVHYKYQLANGEEETILYDHVIACTGFQFDHSIFDESCRPELTIQNRFPAMNPQYESTNVPNLFFAGTLTQMRDFKKKQSGFVHGFRYNCEFLARYLTSQQTKKPLDYTQLPLEKTAISKQILARINKSSALWQQSGYFCDLLILNPNTSTAQYLTNLPKDFAKECYLKPDDIAIIITLDFGQARIDKEPDVFAIDRVHKQNYEQAHKSTALHPILTLWYQSDLKTHHILEDFDSTWGEPEHIIPLYQFIYDTIKFAESTRVTTQKDLVS